MGIQLSCLHHDPGAINRATSRHQSSTYNLGIK